MRRMPCHNIQHQNATYIFINPTQTGLFWLSEDWGGVKMTRGL